MGLQQNIVAPWVITDINEINDTEISPVCEEK